MTDPRRIAHAINPKPFACPADPDDPLGPSLLKETEEERQEVIRRAEGVFVELQAENARLRGALEVIATHRAKCHEYDKDAGHELRDFDAEDVRLMEWQARAALSKAGPVVLVTPEAVKTAVKEARDRALDEAAEMAWSETDERDWEHWGMDSNKVVAQTVSKEISAAIRALKEHTDE